MHPALNNLYPKIAGKEKPLMKIWINNNVWVDLNWAMSHLRDSLGIRLLFCVTWDAEDVDETLFCNTCMQGSASWYPRWWQGFYFPVLTISAHEIIFFYKTLAVTSAFDNLQQRAPNYSKIVIYTDSMNTINIFNTLHCQPELNPMLQFCVDLFLSKHWEVWVLHTPGTWNEVADAISPLNFLKASTLLPGLHIMDFQPPCCTKLGAAEKW